MRAVASALCLCVSLGAHAQAQRTIDVPTRPGVTQRILYIAASKPQAAAVLFPGGQGDLRIAADGGIDRMKGNFLVRSRELFVQHGITVAVIAPPSDRDDLRGFRQTREHAEDVRAVIAWLRKETGVPVWLVGTSRGTQSAGFVATALARADGGADGLVLTSTVLRGANGRDRPVPDMPLERIAVPVLVVHHRQDGCRVTSFSDLPRLMSGLKSAPRKELIAVDGGGSEGDPCEAFAHHGYNGIESDVVAKIAQWITRER